MEYRGHTERGAGPATGTSVGTPDSRVLRRRTENGNGQHLRDRRSLSWCPQPAGRGVGRDGSNDDPQPSQSVLRAAERDRPIDSTESADKQNTRKKSHDDNGDRTGDGAERRISVFESLSTGVILVDQHLLIDDLNASAESLLGISKARASRQPLLPLFGDDAEFRNMLYSALDSGQTYAKEVRLPPSETEKRERVVDCRVSTLQANNTTEGQTILLVEIIDVTRRSRISRENALLSQHDAGRQMIRQLAHEIKNPLGGLRGAAQLLERQLEDEEQREYTAVIISEADRLAALVDTLLGPVGPTRKSLQNVHELLEYVVRLVDVGASGSLRFVRDYDAGLPDVALDRDQILQAILNVMQNAAVALNGQGAITLRTRAIMNFTIGEVRHPVVVSIEIEDDGPGIPQALQESIFYPLVTGRVDGTGLGLPVAQELISRHGGLIEFTSRPGHTVFQLQIPLHTDEITQGG